jgi:hypothetical protein
MWKATVSERIQSNPSRVILAVVLGLSLIAPTVGLRAVIGQESNRVKERYIPIATLRYERAHLTPIDSESSPTGFVLAPMRAQQATKARMAVSGAFAVDTPKVQDVRHFSKSAIWDNPVYYGKPVISHQSQSYEVA